MADRRLSQELLSTFCCWRHFFVLVMVCLAIHIDIIFLDLRPKKELIIQSLDTCLKEIDIPLARADAFCHGRAAYLSRPFGYLGFPIEAQLFWKTKNRTSHATNNRTSEITNCRSALATISNPFCSLYTTYAPWLMSCCTISFPS